jgi:tripartite-type tricarboxylate transporter receptor subunit TctC
MTLSIRRRCAMLALAIVALAFAPDIDRRAAAQPAWPSQPIRFVVAVGAGGAADTTARRVAERLAKALGQPVVVENMPGASGVLAAQTVARANADGYTLLIGTNTTHAGNQSLLKSISYDPVNDFAPISRLGLAGLTLGVAKDLPVKTVAELIAYMKANPNKLNFGSGTGSARFAAEMFKGKTGTQMVHVPYRGNNAALTDLLSGQVSMLFGDTTLMLPQVQAGNVRGLGVSSAERSRLVPELPTIAEAGVPGYELVGWIAAFAPAKTPPAIVSRLNAEMKTILTDAEFVAGLAAIGIDAAPTTQDELKAWVVSETAKWAEIAKAADIKPE